LIPHAIDDVILASVPEPQVRLISLMNTVITSERIDLPPGAVLKLLGNWQDYQRMLSVLGDRVTSRNLCNNVSKSLLNRQQVRLLDG